MAKILVFGDSIAYGKWDSRGGWVARVRAYLDKKYNLVQSQNLQIYNLGIPGEVAVSLAERFEKELTDRVLLDDANEDNLVILAIGINDSSPDNWMTGGQTSEKDFKSSIKDMIDISRKHKCDIIITGLTPVDFDKDPSWGFTNEEVKRYDDYLSDVAKEMNVKKLELLNVLLELDFVQYLVDPVHPNDKGHEIIADNVIKYLE